MKDEKISIRLFEELVLVGGVFSAMIAAPFLYATEPQPTAKSPAGQGTPQTAIPPAPRVERFAMNVEGMRASGVDAMRIEKDLKRIPGVVSVKCDQAIGVCQGELDPAKTQKEDIAVRINDLGFRAYLKTQGQTPTVKETQ